ncbi:DNA polymerase IV [Streptomyces antimycoticus]|uniref:DNA polymerase IV n=1 Tax=Streptomyces antimycoticus TaxID=68175 RepID=UPI0036A36B8F
MRGAPTILHLDMDAFYASAEQASKPSLRGKPVIVGGLGPRGVVATASYEARVFGVHSAMAMAQARRLCPNAAFLIPRFTLYRTVSDAVMTLLHTLSPLVEPLSLDEAFVDLEAGGTEPTVGAARAVGERLRADIKAATGLTGSVGLAGSKMLAKIASEQAKPDGMVVIDPGTERELLGPMSVRTLPGVGPATAETLRRAGIHTVAETREAGEAELVRLLGRAHGASLFLMAEGRDERPVVAERDAKSISVEDTFDVDLTDRTRVQLEITRLADRCVRRLREAGRSGRTVVIKVRRYDFSTLTRSETLRGPTDDPGVVREAAARLIDGVDTTAGVRLLGVGVSGLADYTQEDLFAQAAQAVQAAQAAQEAHEALGDARRVPGPEGPERVGEGAGEASEDAEKPRRWLPGSDVRHAEYGAGWVQGSGVGRVTVRFEEPWSRPGRVRTFAVDDPALEPTEPLPLLRPDADAAPGLDAVPGEPATPDVDGASDADPGPDADLAPNLAVSPDPDASPTAEEVAGPVPEDAASPGPDVARKAATDPASMPGEAADLVSDDVVCPRPDVAREVVTDPDPASEDAAGPPLDGAPEAAPDLAPDGTTGREGTTGLNPGERIAPGPEQTAGPDDLAPGADGLAEGADGLAPGLGGGSGRGQGLGHMRGPASGHEQSKPQPQGQPVTSSP